MKEKRDCMIVCGYPANDDGSISDILQSRIDEAIKLYHQQIVQYIIVSGGAIHNNYCEAEVMYEYAMTYGVSAHHILKEDKAKSTYHNMMYSQEIMNQNHLKTCYIITNSWHMVKAEYYAKKFQIDYIPIKCHKPQSMSFFKVYALTLYMPINMFINRLKGYK